MYILQRSVRRKCLFFSFFFFFLSFKCGPAGVSCLNHRTATLNCPELHGLPKLVGPLTPPALWQQDHEGCHNFLIWVGVLFNDTASWWDYTASPIEEWSRARLWWNATDGRAKPKYAEESRAATQCVSYLSPTRRPGFSPGPSRVGVR